MATHDISQPSAAGAAPVRNRFDLPEWAGAFGDLGTLIPFVVAYIAVLGLDPAAVLLPFGVALVVVGARYRTPMPVQPMKAAGAIAVTEAGLVGAAAVQVATLATGAIWLVLAFTGLAQRLARAIPRPVVVGIVLGLGFALMIQGLEMMRGDWLVAGVAFAAALLLLASRKVPAMLVLLVLGGVAAIVRDPSLARDLAAISFDPRLPELGFANLSWRDAWIGIVLVALPQVPLTFGNAMVAITEENNRLFPDRRVNERTIAASTGMMNLLAAPLGGVPMCHGAGGMAGHVRFGARTGGATVILGVLLAVVALCFASSAQTLLKIVPGAVLGVILFLAGAQIALGSCDFSKDKGERFTTLVTAAFAIWNVGAAFVVGLALHAALKRRLVRL